MLDVHIQVTSIDPDQTIKRRMVVGNIGGGANSSYQIAELDEDGRPVRDALLENYPRWSESAGGLIARAMSAVWTPSQPETVDNGTVMDAKVDAHMRSRPVFAWVAFFQGESGILETWEEGIPVAPREIERPLASNWQEFVLTTTVFATFGVPELPPRPDPIRVPVRKSGSVPYVRIQDIPEPARSAFVRNIHLSTIPVIENEGSCAYAWDFEDFLAGRR